MTQQIIWARGVSSAPTETGRQVRQAAERRNALMRRDDMAAIRRAYESQNEWLWQLADLLLDMVEGGVAWPLRAQVRETIFKEAL